MDWKKAEQIPVWPVVVSSGGGGGSGRASLRSETENALMYLRQRFPLSTTDREAPPSRLDALARLREILAGIDQDGIDAEGGWWETSTGAEFGAARLAELEELIRDLT